MVLLGALVGMLVLALAVPLLARVLGRDTGYALAAGFAAIGLLLLIGGAGTVDAGGAVTGSWAWLPGLDVDLALRLDGLSALFCLLVLGVGTLIMAYCPRYLKAGESGAAVYTLLTLFAGAMLGLVLAADVVLLYVFWELTTVLSFLLIKTAGPHGGRSATRALVVTGAGGFALLAGLVLLSVAAGTTDLTEIIARGDAVLASPLAGAAGVLLVFAAFTKSAQLPFGFWLPGAMVAVTPISAYLHAATMVKAGIYLLMRIAPVYAPTTAWSAVLVVVGLATAVTGALLALREHDLKAVLAQSTVSQLGLLVAAIGVGTPTALAAAVLHTFAHALFKATLFMLVGIVDKAAGSRDIRELTGLWRVMPVTAALTALAALSMAGVPPLLGFVSKESLFEGFRDADFAPGAGPVALTLAVSASVLTFAYAARIVHGAFGGRPAPDDTHSRPPWAFVLPPAVAGLLGLVLGPGVDLLNPMTSGAVAQVAPGSGPTDFEFWHGLSLELLLSAVTIATGLTLFALRARVDRALQPLPVPDGAAVFDRIEHGLRRLGGVVGGPDRDPSPAAVLGRVVAATVVAGAVGWALLGPRPTPLPVDTTLDLPLLVLLAVAVVATVTARSTVAMLGLLGVTGLVVTVWFLVAGAPDVALTLLLVEVLTTVAAAFALRRRRERPRSMPRRRVAPAALLAGAAGVVAAAATAALAGRRAPSEAGAYLLDQAVPQTGGTNVVNTILVDFRAADTFGESVVVGVAGLGLLALLGAPGRPAVGDPPAEVTGPPADAVVVRIGARVLVPATLVMSAWLFWRGHDEPGGGFIAALVAGIGLAFLRLAEGPRNRATRLLSPQYLIGGGLLLALAVGLLGPAVGATFLAPIALPVGPASSIVFDLGVYLMVVGMLLAVVDRLAAPTDAAPRDVRAGRTGAESSR